jgi:hypothetical protein
MCMHVLSASMHVLSASISFMYRCSMFVLFGVIAARGLLHFEVIEVIVCEGVCLVLVLHLCLLK